MRVSQGAVSLWYGTADAPAPSGVVADGADTSVTIGLEPLDPHAKITILYRINHGGPLTIAAEPSHNDASGKKQYFHAKLSGFKPGDKVEYVAICRSGSRQIPANHEAEQHVATFTIEAPDGTPARHVGGEHHGPDAPDLKEALRSALRASSVVSGAAEEAFIKLYFSHTGDSQAFWEEVAKHADLKPHIDKLKFALQLDLLTSGFAPLISALVKKPGVKTVQDLAKLDDFEWHSLIAKSGAPPHISGASKHTQEQLYCASILATLQAAFPMLTVCRIAAACKHIDPLAVKFLENATELDIRTGRIETYAEHHAAEVYKGIAEAKKAEVLKEVKRIQRLFSVSPNADAFRALLDTKFESAHAIAIVPRATFTSHYAKTLGGEAQATEIHERAQFINARNLNLRTSIQDAVHTPPTRGLGHHSEKENQRMYSGHRPANSEHEADHTEGHENAHKPEPKKGSLKDDLVERFPNSGELFGSMCLCNCEECESAIGPAAYLVDVFDFLGTSKENKHHATPLDVLIGNPAKKMHGRRPDLAHMKLTCSNTNTSMPYIDIVNEILESYVALGLKLDGSSAQDTGQATTPELDANPQHINQRAYSLLDKAVYPFTLPFNRPLHVTRSYLGQLGGNRHDILHTFNKDQTSARMKHLLAAESLAISAEEFQILSGHPIDSTTKAQPVPLHEYYGYLGAKGGSKFDDGHGHQVEWIGDLSDAGNFIQRTGVSFSELRALVATRFVNPEQATGAAKQLLMQLPISYKMLSVLLKSNLTQPVEALFALDAAGIKIHELDILAHDNFDKIKKMLVIDDPESSCDPSEMKLMHLDGSPPDEHLFERMHRFIRMVRKMGWTISDLDHAIHAMGTSTISPELIVHLAHMKHLQSAWRITNVQILLALWAPMETCGADSLYRGLFLNRATLVQDMDPAFDQPFPDSEVLTNSAEKLVRHLPVLRAAMRVSAADLDLILADCGLVAEKDTLTIQNVSALYRRAALAKALKLRINDFLTLKSVCGCDPFTSPEHACQFTDLVKSVSASGLVPTQLNYILRHIDAPAGAGALDPADSVITTLASSVRTGMAAIVRDNVYVADPTGTLTAQKLATLYESDVVDGITGLINGTVNYSASPVILPASFAFPPQLAKKLVYDPNAQLLTAKAPLTTADRTALLGLSADPAFHAAIDSIYQQPLDLIATSTGAFLTVADAQKNLITDTASVDADLNPILLDASGTITTDPTKAQTTAIGVKFAYLLKGLLPYLAVTQGAALMKTTISKSLKISDAMAGALIEKVIVSRLDPSRHAIHDMHQLRHPGLSQSTYTSADLSGTPAVSIAPAIAFDGNKHALGSGVLSAAWTGMVAAPGSGDFVFSIQTAGTPTLWVDDLSTPLALTKLSDTGEFVATHVTFKAGQLYNLRLDVAQLPAQKAAATLRWQSAAVRKSVVPAANLYPDSVLQAFRQTYIVLLKSALVVNALKLSDTELLFLEQKHDGTVPVSLSDLPVARDVTSVTQIDKNAPTLFQGLHRAMQLVALRKALPASTSAITDVFAASTLPDAITQLINATGWDAGVVSDLAGPAGFNLQYQDLRNEHWPIRLLACVNLAARLGVAANYLFRWAVDTSDFNALDEMAHEIKKCVHAQYDADTWLTVAKPLNDKLRDAQRNALVAYLLPRMQLQDADQLFEYFLIDPQMAPVTETSRISLAHSSVQMFVERCLMNLEASDDIDCVTSDQIDSVQWNTWRKHYRYWQANYEVLLHPENWMQQSFRDDKTPFFEGVESDLSQGEISADTVETAYLNYLEKLQQVARLEIIGMFWQDKDPDTNEQIDTLHIIGRTFHAPHTYFYRTFVNFTTWTPWEEMQVSIDGDTVMPLIWNRRLYVFWPVFSKKAVPPVHKDTIDATSKNIPVNDAKSYWQVCLAWTELKHNKWSAKQLSKNAFDMDPGYYVEDEPSRYANFAYSFNSSVAQGADAADESLIIRCLFHGLTVSINPLGWFFSIKVKETTEVVGAFEVGGCSGESVEAIFGTMPWSDPIVPPETNVEALTFSQNDSKPGLSLVTMGSQQPSKFLTASPSRYRLLYPHQFSDYMLQAPLFYQDKHCCFFVVPHEDSNHVEQMNGSGHVRFQREPAAKTQRGKAASDKKGKSSKPADSKHPVHPDAGKVSEVLLELEKKISDIGESYTRHASARGAAWSGHALDHNVHPSSATHVRFETFYHPFVCEFTKCVTRLGVKGLLTEENQRLTEEGDFFEKQYKPTALVAGPMPANSVDFDNGPYAIYNQELFFHIPDLIAERLLQNQRFDDAIRWLKYIFDPTDHSTDEVPPDRYWKYQPFKRSSRDSINDLLDTMESGDQQHSQLISDWAKNPFAPYVIARHRIEAYKKNIFMKYIRTHIAQGDALFQTDLKEAVNEAEQHYVIAAHLLGPRPENIASLTKPKPESYATLREKIEVSGELLALLENEFPFSGRVTRHPKSDSGGIQNMGRTLYFCAPANDKLNGLWDIVADRLYKIRNSLNFEGVFRQLALFDPPIDPGLLVRAAAQGMDLGSIMGDIQAPLPAYRFSYMLQKAIEMCNECRTFGGAFLQALEKNDAEGLAVMRSTQEVGMLDMMQRVKQRQLDEANAQIDTLTASRNTAGTRYTYYQGLMGVSGAAVPGPNVNIPLAPIPFQPSADVLGIQLIPEEALEMTLSTTASVMQAVAGSTRAVATILYLIPEIGVCAHPMGVGADVTTGGDSFADSVKSAAETIRTVGEVLGIAGSLSGKMGSYFRRQAEWTLQNNLAACEIMQIDKQIAAAQIRVEIAQYELDAHQKQMDNAQAILDYMTNRKFTNQDLYGWMVSDLSSSYFACYQMAYAIAKKAERTFRYERGLTDSDFIQFGYWDSLRKGLLAGDRLHLALLQMEAAYTEQNTREYEISRSISLVLNSPLALISLKETGTCEIGIPESFFDADYPGHYMRRLKTLNLTIPCVVGPYTSLNCTLTMLSNKTRVSSDPGDQYLEDQQNGDSRFVNNFAALQSIATSHGQNDAGIFEVNFRDERYLPFEGAGVISRWRITMPKANNAFDFETISDVILNFKYTARDGGDPLRQAANQALAANPQTDQVRLFSLRHEFPGNWYQFMHPTDGTSGQTMTVDLSQLRFPYLLRGKTITVAKVELFLNLKDINDAQTYTQDGTPLGDYKSSKPLALSLAPPGGTGVSVKLSSDKALFGGIPHGVADVSSQTAGTGTWTIAIQNDDIAALAASLRTDGGASKLVRLLPGVFVDLALAVHYSAS